MDFKLKDRYNIDDLRQIMEVLRGENGCPWDRVQTHKSIRKNFIEETYEVIEAIDEEDSALLREELGDVLLQVVFHAKISEDEGDFNLDDVANDICEKLIVRHPHVFSDVSADTAEEVLVNWDKIKKETKNQKTYTETLQSVAKSLPALMRSEKVQGRAKKAGFDYPDYTYAVKDLKSEVQELEEGISKNDVVNIDEEIGDILFSCVNVSRFFDIDCEKSLTNSIEKFINRFSEVEKLAEKEKINMKESSIEELDALWKKAKKSI